MQEKKQKKIKASGTPAKLGTFDYSRCTRKNFPALGRGPFLVLMQEKKAKEDQGVRDASQIWLGACLDASNLRDLAPSTVLDVPGQTSPPSEEGLSFFCFFSSIKERKEGLIRKPSKASHVSENKRSPVEWTGDLLGLS